MSIQYFLPNEDPAKMITALQQDGCVVIKNILTEDNLLQQRRQELYTVLDKLFNCQGDFYGYKTRRCSGLVVKMPSFRQIIIHPLILTVMDAFLLKGCRQYQLNLTQAICIGPGEPRQFLHCDDLMFPMQKHKSEKMINCMYAIDDFTAQNGATCVVPGSHLWPEIRKPEAHEIISATMLAGSVLIYLGSLIHGGGANTTSTEYRAGIVISYNLGWLRQAENQYLAVPQELARTLPQRLQRLLGYFVHAPNLGCLDGQDPIKCLLQEESSLFQEFMPEELQKALAQL